MRLPWFAGRKGRFQWPINFPPDLERLVKHRMARGGYQSEDEVLRDALRALEEIAFFRPDPDAGRIGASRISGVKWLSAWSNSIAARAGEPTKYLPTC